MSMFQKLSTSGCCIIQNGVCISPHLRDATAPNGPGTSHYGGFTMKLRRPTLGRTFLHKLSACRRDLYLTTRNLHKQQTSIPLAGFEPRSSSKRAAADPLLRPRGHCNRPVCLRLHF